MTISSFLHYSTVNSLNASEIYSHCQIKNGTGNPERGCVYVGPTNCIDTKKCEHLLAFIKNEKNADVFDFKLFGTVPDQNKDGKYIAMGISAGPVMGLDAVVSCTYEPNKPKPVVIELSFNTPTVYGNEPLTDKFELEQLKPKDMQYVDEKIVCEFSLSRITSVNGEITFDLDTEIVIFIAEGPMRFSKKHNRKRIGN